MSQEQFTALMPYIISDLVSLIAENDQISENIAMERLYNSQLYKLLEQEDLKLWQYSSHMLYSLFQQEQKTGNILFPEV